jgi:hypothetical protein
VEPEPFLTINFELGRMLCVGGTLIPLTNIEPDVFPASVSSGATFVMIPTFQWRAVLVDDNFPAG